MVIYNNKSINSNAFKFINLKKQYIRRLLKTIDILNSIKNKFYQSLFFFFYNNFFLLEQNQNFLISYIVCFYFSTSNTLLQITDALGNSKLFCSAGLLDFKGKQKISRKFVLNQFFNVLSLSKSKFLKNNPIILHFKNVGSNKFLIIKKLKQNFFIKSIKTFELNAYNGCRKRKNRRKR